VTTTEEARVIVSSIMRNLHHARMVIASSLMVGNTTFDKIVL
jgi:hypothetical protein